MRPDGIRKGPPPGPARDGDKQQARHTVRHHVSQGWLPRASTLPCVDCGLPARDYDHYLGYDAVHHLDVQPVCRRCHQLRNVARGEWGAGTGRPQSVPACIICGRDKPPYSHGRCRTCYGHLNRWGIERPPVPFKRGLSVALREKQGR